jgi:hypothetical protein
MERTAGAMMVRHDFRELHGEVNAKLDKLNEDRREDVRGLHARLNDLFIEAALVVSGKIIAVTRRTAPRIIRNVTAITAGRRPPPHNCAWREPWLGEG